MPPVATAAVAIAFFLDLTFHEVPERAHPVAWFGRCLGRLEGNWTHPRLVSAVGAVGLPILAALAIAFVTALAGAWHPAAEAIVAGLALFTTTSLRMLLDLASEVLDLSDRDPAQARVRLPGLVGRETAELSPGDIRSAAVESAAENLADGLVAPLLAFVLLSWSLPIAVGGAAWVKAVNTGDSVLGYRSQPVGWAFARLDDLVMWIPARVTSALIAAAAFDLDALRRARRWAREPDSPNAGWPMATLAAVLTVRLEKPGAYTLGPGGALPSVAEARRGVTVVGRAGLMAFGIAAVVTWH